MNIHIAWSGNGEPVLFLPGWNTTAATVMSWIPSPFLTVHRCGVLEWPGLGAALTDPLPASLEALLDGLESELPEEPVVVVGFCLGGVAAWALAQRHPARVRCVILAETLLHFPAVLAPLLIPGLGWMILVLAKGTRLGRACVRRAILRPMSYPQPFLQELFAFEAGPALHYLRLFRAYGEGMPIRVGPHHSVRPCASLSGAAKLRVLVPAWGCRHRVETGHQLLEQAGHFPAVENPTGFFGALDDLLVSACPSEPSGS
jgi:pimeloyl-ACP methyl ester carboxylesterase